MRIYLDNCCFNRPFDDQTQIRISLETEAKLFIQSLIASNKVDFVWSYILQYENNYNPYLVRRNAIYNFSKYACDTVIANNDIIAKAKMIKNNGIKEKDSLHIACAIYAKCDYFITTDDKLLKYSDEIIKIVDPNNFIKVWVEGDYE